MARCMGSRRYWAVALRGEGLQRVLIDPGGGLLVTLFREQLAF